MEGTITREESEAKMSRGDDFVLVEALCPRSWSYEVVHPPGAINPSLESPDEGAEIVVYRMDAGCATSGETVRELPEMGYENVRRYAGDKQGSIDAGLPVEGRRASDG